MFQSKDKGRESWKTKIRVDGKDYVRGIGTDKVIAADIERMLHSFKAQRKHEWLKQIMVTKTVEPGAAYDAWIAQQIDAFFADLARAATQAEDDPDLDPLVSAWETECSTPKYVRQVRRFIPAKTPFPLSAFRRAAIVTFLNTLAPVENRTKDTIDGTLKKATRNRYKVAISTFAEWLLERELRPGVPLLAANPALGLKTKETKKQKDARREEQNVYHVEADTKRLVLALAEPFRSMEALMAASAAEWGACKAATPADFDFETWTFHARGTKNKNRWRWIEITEPWAREIVKARVLATKAGQKVWPQSDKHALKAHHAARVACELTEATTLHNHRDAFAIMWIDRGAQGNLRHDKRDRAWLCNQLGHTERSVMLETTYGAYIKRTKLMVQARARVALEAEERERQAQEQAALIARKKHLHLETA